MRKAPNEWMDGTPFETLHPIKPTYSSPKKWMALLFRGAPFSQTTESSASTGSLYYQLQLDIVNPNLIHYYKGNPSNLPYTHMMFDPFDPPKMDPIEWSLVPWFGKASATLASNSPWAYSKAGPIGSTEPQGWSSPKRPSCSEKTPQNKMILEFKLTKTNSSP